MKRYTLFLVVICVLIWAPVTEALVEVEVLSPVICTRNTGEPIIETFVFIGFSGPATVKLKNGSLEDDSIEKVSSSTVTVNGQVAFDSSDFNQKVDCLEKEIMLTEKQNTLEVLLKGKPGGRVTLQITQQVEAEAAAVIGSAGGLVEVSNPASLINGASITFPAGALTEDVIVSLSQGANVPELPADVSADGVALEFGPHGTVLEQLCLIRLPVPIQPADDEFLAIAYYNCEIDEWELLPVLSYDPIEGIAEFATDHFSIFIMVIVKHVPDTVSLDFDVNTDSLSFDNYNFEHCPEEEAGVCAGIAIYAKWYYENYGHGLKCRYDRNKAEEIACEVYKNYAQGWGVSSKVLAWFAWLGFKELSVFDYNQAAFIIDSLRKGKPTILGLWGWDEGIVGHSVLVTEWHKTGEFSGYFTCYDVNYNTKQYHIPCSKSALGWTFDYNMCPENPEYCPNYSVFMPYVDFWLGLESVYEKYDPDDYCAVTTVLTFEDLSGTQGSMPDPYHGIIDWEDGVWFHYDWSQPPYNPASGVVRTYESSSDTTPSWDFLTPVVYEGSYFSGYSYATVQMELYLDGGLVHSTGIFVPSATPDFFATGYNGLVDRVVIHTPAPDYWVMDDLTYSSSVPEMP